MNMLHAPLRLALTMGDPCGIGPELWVRILCEPCPAPEAQPVVQRLLLGDAGVLERAATRLGLSSAWQRALTDPTLLLHSVTSLTEPQSEPGKPTQEAGAAQVAYLQAAVNLAVRGDVQGLCTAPIHKGWAKAAGLLFPGHTELLGAHLRSAPKEVMMLAGPSLRVALASTHLALREVAGALSIAGLVDTLVTVAHALRLDFGIAAPRLWVAGLNPHAGEGGHFGDEEARIIAPAIAQAQAAFDGSQPADIQGPMVPDALFRAAVFGPPAQRPDAVVALYHDQGLIPLKLLDFDRAVNVTLGLRVVRTSPDHGVAYDIAGRGLARPDSQRAALDLCTRLTLGRAASSAR
ncbi:MAG: 4-hydroxythreonine-4-phosphate dehydrogenase PdxA [Myxococcales bacterium]|nr:4-hydroxythreonine-4-phosphate dehydrogenase PdxA [Myxococcales bacterium]